MFWIQVKTYLQKVDGQFLGQWPLCWICKAWSSVRSCEEQESESKSPSNEVRSNPQSYCLMKVRGDKNQLQNTAFMKIKIGSRV